MKICIYGAGAIGGLIGTRLAVAGDCEVSAVARGATLAALQQQGWRLRQGERLFQAAARATADPRELGAQDLVVIAVKGQALPEVASRIAPLLKSDTIVIPALNGVPWWFSQVVDGLGGAALSSVDPGGQIAAAIPIDMVVGCVVHASASTPEPGLVLLKMGNGLIIGEPAGGESLRVSRVGALLETAGFDVTRSTDIRQALWYKLWGNLTINPLCALTGASTGPILSDPLVRAFVSAAMLEASAVGARVGCAIDQRPEDRHAITAKLGDFKPSMLQDVEAGRCIELDPIVTAVHEMAQRLGVATPNIDAILGLTRISARLRGLYPADAGSRG